MTKNDIWNLMYALGNTGRITGDAANPQARGKALAGADIVTKNGWRVWVEHKETGKRIFESPAEITHRHDQESNRIIQFAEDNVPGFARR